MNSKNATRVQERGPIDPTKRRLLISCLSAYSASLIPWAWSQPVKDSGHGAFIALSAILTGRQALDQVQAERLFAALSKSDPGFVHAMQAILDLINKQHIDPLALQKILDDGHPTVAMVPRKIVLAWYVGVVGEGDQAHCLAYETALMSVVVADRLKPPSYAYGAYGSWEKSPT
ncbi:hypothetical protein EKL30_02280 [Candidimonas sp. SYP-B2681]|uniref:sugar dehydrogenase complex small subunit n=1 Tax=Candidimonas sp. SYP-B2681 TaxID=2497686 RepID=UPI000F879B66|nr:sugar dehydrogenase complex small subunit [Candidimonas sp. SYP-B2681]RTZ47829.1 hypothetical protein EKL30_02280 [Candidimonas sp. SYP-B2681]